MSTEQTPRISTDPAELDIPLIHRFLSEESPWGRGIPLAVVEQGIRHSLSFGLYLGQAQVGFARVITDHATFAYLTDVFVLPAFQGRGWSRLLVSAIMDHPSVKRARRVLLVSTSARGLYAKFGFVPPPHVERFMEITAANPYGVDAVSAGR
ncbi:MAG: GNAT family N-acetyltransferase [Pseudomonadota bacterium]